VVTARREEERSAVTSTERPIKHNWKELRRTPARDRQIYPSSERETLTGR
jgi:hypothetical protein